MLSIDELGSTEAKVYDITPCFFSQVHVCLFNTLAPPTASQLIPRNRPGLPSTMATYTILLDSSYVGFLFLIITELLYTSSRRSIRAKVKSLDVKVQRRLD